MKCPYCAYDETKVSDSREAKDGAHIKRRRECVHCSKRFTTVERVLKLDLEVQKSNGDLEVFNLEKMKRGILKACEKRPVTLEQIDKVVANIVRALKKFSSNKIPSSDVGKIVLKHLRKLDEIAFLRFAIVYNNYETMSEFSREIAKLKSFKV